MRPRASPGASVARIGRPRGFPLGRWVDSHASVRHNLALSGMRGALKTVPRILRDPPEAESEDLSTAIAHLHHVDPARVFLTHGAHEANFLALAYLTRGGFHSRTAPTIRVEVPEYPPLSDIAHALGGPRVRQKSPGDIWLLSNPNNPTGRLWSAREILTKREATTSVIVDETFREFTEARSVIESRADGLWVTGTFTKVYGADAIRVGWLIPPAQETEAYAPFHAVAADRIAVQSVHSATAILSARESVLREVRGIFARNLQAVHRAVGGTENLSGPIWFDRGRGELPGDRVQAEAIRRSILVCSGTFFGDPHGVRICLTRPSFPEDLDQYLAVRERFLDGNGTGR
jgi:histidinol-phosphate/aromatic aminotransferase/cobyric acid decarboxylase-like protein